MANTARKLQTNFNSGELSPFVEGRPDLAKFFTGARVVENFLLQVEGGAFFRYGTRYIAAAKYADKKVILATFSFNTTNEYLLEIGEQYMRIYRNGVRVQQASSTELIVNGGFNSNIVGWDSASSGNGSISWDNGRLKLNLPSAGFNNRAQAFQIISTVIGSQYTLRFDIASHAVNVFAANNPLGFGSVIYDPGAGHSLTFTATTTTTYISFWISGSSPGFAHVDNVSVRVDSIDPLEIVTPWLESELKDIQWKQSADVLYFVHPSYQPRKLSRLSDTNWQFGLFSPNPPPTTSFDEDVSGGTVTASLDAVTGMGVTVTLSGAVALAADVGRVFVSGAGKGTITAQAGSTYTIDVIDNFPSTSIAAGAWFLRLAPQTTLDADKKGPAGTNVTLAAGVAAFRPEVVGRYIRIWDGLVKVTSYTSNAAISGTILLELSGADNKNPPVADEGTWNQEIAAWSDTLGWPRAIEFHQGRLWFGYGLPAAIAGSASDDFENFATGVNANNAVVYGIKSVNPISWLISLRDLFIGDPDKERAAKGPGVDEPLGGDVIPFVTDEGDFGAMHCLPAVVNRAVLFIKEFGRRLVQFAYDWEQNAFSENDLNVFSRHLTDPNYGGSPFVQHPPVYVSEPNQLVFVPREDGQAVALSYYRPEQVFGWSRLVTQGKFLSFAAVRNSNSSRQIVYAALQRSVQGVDRTYIEAFEDNAQELAGNDWQAFYTDSTSIQDNRIPFSLTLSAVAGVGVTATLSGATFVAGHANGEVELWEVGGNGRALITAVLSSTQAIVDVLSDFSALQFAAFESALASYNAAAVHLEGLYVDVFTTEGYAGRPFVISGIVTLSQKFYFAVIGLPYVGTIQSMRPSIQNAVVEGLKRRWTNVQLRLVKSTGGRLNGKPIAYPPVEYQSLRAEFLGITGEDKVGEDNQVTPNGTLDFHISLKGLRDEPAEILIRGNPGQWHYPYDGTHWIIAVEYNAATRSAELFFEQYVNTGDLIVSIAYADGSREQVVAGARSGLFTGDTEKMNQELWDTEGYLTITQDQPAPLNVVSVFGSIEFGDG